MCSRSVMERGRHHQVHPWQNAAANLVGRHFEFTDVPFRKRGKRYLHAYRPIRKRCIIKLSLDKNRAPLTHHSQSVPL